MTRFVKRNIKYVFGILSILLPVIVNAQVTISNNLTKQYSQYDVTGAIPPRSFWDQVFGRYPNVLTSGIGKITINFPPDTHIPNNLAEENVQITGVNYFDETNTTTVQSLSVSAQSVSFITPIDLIDGTDFTVTFLVSAKIKNPSTAGNYTISYNHDTSGGTINLAAYTINQSNTTLANTTVGLNPSIETRNAAYSVTFSTGAAGGMTANSDYFTVTFPNGTLLPDGNVAGVNINGIPSVAVGNSTTRTIQITTPIDLDNEQEVNLIFTLGSSLSNPLTGTYSLSLSSNVEPTVINSANYFVTAQSALSNPSVTLGSSFVNATTNYSIRFNNGTTKALVPFNDRIRITLPAAMQVPGTIDASNININSGGFTDIPNQLTISGNQLLITTPISIAEGEEVEIYISSGAGISNPALTGNYTLNLRLEESGGSVIEGPVTSSNFLISSAPSSTSKAFVDISNSSTNTNSNYTIDFNTGQFGKLTANVSTIQILLPQDTRFGSLNTISVNGQNASYSTTNNPRSLTITTPVTIENNSPVHLEINRLRNPRDKAAYAIDIYTSTEQTPIRSNTYNVGYTALTNVSFSLSNLGVNSTSQYEVNLRTTANMFSDAAITDYFRIIFPEDVELPASINKNDLTLRVGGNNRAIKQLNISQANRIVDVYPNVDVNGNSNVSITFPVGIGIRNPIVPSNSVYRGTVYSTADLEPVNTASISYAPNTVATVLDTVVINPSIINANNAKYTIRFTTGENGRLSGSSTAGASYIEILFPSNATSVPNSINPGDVLVNNQAASQITILKTGFTNGRIRIYLAQNQVIEGNELITVVINANAGLLNGATASTYRLRVMTSSESSLSTKVNTMKLLSQSSLEVTSLAVSPKAINSPAAFTVKIKPGFTKDVQIGETIKIRFPNETTVPSGVSKSYVLVNGVQPTASITVSGQTITIPSPILLPGETLATISISSLAGITNPPIVASTWRVYVTTTNELIEVASPTYTTELASSTIGTPSVSLSDNAINKTATYTIGFQTGTQGALTAGSSIITLRMPTGTIYGALSATVNGTASLSVSRSGNDIMIQVPSAVTIGSSSQVSIILNGLTNPLIIGSYQLLAKTNVENTFVNSSSYTLALLSLPITIPIGSILGASTDTVNINSEFTIPFTLSPGGNLSSNSGTITLEFPVGTEFPNSIPIGSIKINGTNVTSSAINFAQRRLVLTTPINLPANTQHSITISSNSGIKNPPQPDQYYLKASTSAQPLFTSTSTYSVIPSLFTKITNLSLVVSPTTSDTPLRWTWTMSTGLRGAIMPGKGEIKLNFDNATNLNNVSKFDLTVNGVVPKAVRDSSTFLIITIPSNLTVKSGGALTIILNEGANVQIPSSVNKSLSKKSNSSESPKTQELHNYSASSSSEPTESQFQSNPLPVELTNLNVTIAQDEHTSSLYTIVNWATLSETENYGFKIMRRKLIENPEEIDDQKMYSKWNELNFTQGKGYSRERVDYQFEDISISEAGLYQYQIVQIDFSGQTEIFGPIDVKIDSPKQFALFTNYPNPFNPTTSIPYSIARTTKVQMIVFDILGRQVQILVNKELNPGNYIQTFNASQFASGVYIIQMRAEGKYFNKKIMLIK